MQQFGRREMALRQGIDLVCDLAFSSFFTVCCATTISFGLGATSVVLHRRDDGEREIQGAAPGRRLGAVALHAAPLWCCWLASSGSGKQAARMQWFQAAPAHWRGSQLLLYVSLAHGQQHRH